MNRKPSKAELYEAVLQIKEAVNVLQKQVFVIVEQLENDLKDKHQKAGFGGIIDLMNKEMQDECNCEECRKGFLEKIREAGEL